LRKAVGDVLLPLRFRVLTELALNGPQDVTVILRALEPDYGRERQFKRAMLENHLRSLSAVGLVEDVNLSLDESGGLVRTVAITDAGRDLLKYLPKDWRARTASSPAAPVG